MVPRMKRQSKNRNRLRLARTAFGLSALLASASPLEAAPLAPASETGPCSLAQTSPATVALVDDDFDLLLDDGRRVALAGLEFPGAKGDATKLRADALHRLSTWLAGAPVFISELTPAPDRWGRRPAQVIASAGPDSDSPLVSIGATLLSAGLARYRPDPAAGTCIKVYLRAEGVARDKKLGIWAVESEIELARHNASLNNSLAEKKGLVALSGVVQSVGETRSALFLNFGPRKDGDFAVMISQRNLAIFESSGVALRTLAGRRVRVRGLIETNAGLRMEIASPAELELLDGDVAP
jgi:endonuclease YncB( thermonuclease family)